MSAAVMLFGRPVDWTEVPLTRHTIRTFVADALHGTEQESETADINLVQEAIIAQTRRPLTWDEGAYVVRAIRSERLMQTATRLHRPFRVFA